EGADERPHLLGRQPADTHRGAAASGHREIVPRAELLNLPLQGSSQEVHIAQILWRGREAERADQGRGSVCGSGSVVREIDQHWPAGCFKQLQGSSQDACLKGRITWCPQRSSQFEGDPEGAWWGNLDRMFSYQADLCRGQTVPFEIIREPADGARAGGSDRDEAHG